MDSEPSVDALSACKLRPPPSRAQTHADVTARSKKYPTIRCPVDRLRYTWLLDILNTGRNTHDR